MINLELKYDKSRVKGTNLELKYDKSRVKGTINKILSDPPYQHSRVY